MMFKLVFYLAGLSACLALKPLLQNRQSVKQIDDGLNYRLPNNTEPLAYEIHLTTHVHNDTHPEQFDFDGRVRININILMATKEITLHHRQLTIQNVSITGDNGFDEFPIISYNSTREFVILTVSKELKTGEKYLLDIQYNGVLRGDNGGFYRSSYKDKNGNQKWIATTQFESTDARHAFPCYDEPGRRATIKLTIVHGSTYHAISNMPGESRPSLTKGYTITEFEVSPLMQPYILAFVVSDFGFVADKNQRAFARQEAIDGEEAHFALEAGIKVLDAIEKYLKVAYSLTTMDQIAIPDFAAGAMENWGLVTYREEVFLYDKEKSPMVQKKTIAGIVGHEFGHQWFGNLVAPQWWGYIWLNEGFATFFEYLGANIAYPEYQIDELFTVEKLQNAFGPDALDSTRPMTYYVQTPEAISAVFDDIAYSKSGSFLRMIQHAISDPAFSLGLRYYLGARQYQAAVPEDLAKGLQKACDELKTLPEGVQFLDILNSWSLQKGYPVVEVSRSDDGNLTLKQERFLLKSIEGVNKTTWWIPFNMATKQQPDFSNTLPNGWLTTETTTVSPSKALNWTNDDWIVMNKKQTGYYRVNYDDKLWRLIIKQLNTTSDYKIINNLNRAQLVDDAFNLARSSRLLYDIPLELIEYIRNERDYVPWAATNNNLGYLKRLLSGSKRYGLFQEFVLPLVEPTYKDLGLESKPEEKLFPTLSRNIAINWACSMGSEDCLNKTTIKLEEIITAPAKDKDANTRSTIYCNGVRDAENKTFLFLWTKMQKSLDQAERQMIIGALGCSHDEEMLQVLLDSSIDESVEVNYRGQERSRVLSSVYNNGAAGLNLAMDFLDKNAKKIDELYNSGSFGGRAIGNAIVGMGRVVVSKDQNKKFESLIKKMETDGYVNENESARAKEVASENIDWTDKHGPTVEKWLMKKLGKSSAVAIVPTFVTILMAFIVYILN